MAIGSTVSTTEPFPIFTVVEELFVVNGNQVYLYVKLFRVKNSMSIICATLLHQLLLTNS